MKFFIISLLFLIATACGASDNELPASVVDGPGFRKKFFYLEAPCTVKVVGIGTVDIEEEYIAGVIACENPHAPFEALKAQAVEARTYLYYKLFIEGKTELRNGQKDQVFSCAHAPNGPSMDHKRAAAETKGEYLSWNDSIIASFFVAGAIPPTPDAGAPFTSCKPNGGSDPTHTQKWVTYNRGKTQCDVTMTPLGFRTDACEDFPYNRGCASQNGHACLAKAKVAYQDQFSFFYGDDIKLKTSEGACGGSVDPPNKYDSYCKTKNDGSFCFDNASLIRCVGKVSERIEECVNGCSEKMCQAAVIPSFCSSRTDQKYCNAYQSITCLAGEISDSSACTYKCENGECVEKTSHPQSENVCEGNHDGYYCVDDLSVECLNEKVSSLTTCDALCVAGKCKQKIGEGAITTDSEVGLITESEGINEGGCNSVSSSPSFLFLFLCFLGFIKIQKKRVI